MTQPRRAPRWMAGVLCGVTMLSGCASTKRQVARSVLTLAPDLVASFYDEPDLESARAAASGTINLLEAIRRADPAHPVPPLLLAEAFGGMAFYFLQDDADRLAATDRVGSDAARSRARGYFRRGRAHAAALLARRSPVLARTLAQPDVLTLRRALDAEHDRDLVPLLFWYAFNWMGEIGATEPAIARPADLPRLRLLVNRVADLDEHFQFGAPRLMQAVLWCALPEAYGGDLDEGQRAFERAIAISDGRLLLVRVEYARFYGVARRDRSLFDAQLRAVMDAPSDTLPGYRLLTEAAKRTGGRLVATADAVFARAGEHAPLQ